MKQRASRNPKRRIAPVVHWSEDQRLEHAKRVRYGGNPQHKTRPGNYDLNPPTSPRPGKTLCDADRPLLKGEAIRLLRAGIRKGMISEREKEGWPQNIWSVSEKGEVFEAQLENETQGVYHGYPLQFDDAFRALVENEWIKR